MPIWVFSCSMQPKMTDCSRRVCCGQDLKSVSLVKVIIDLESHTDKTHCSTQTQCFVILHCTDVQTSGCARASSTSLQVKEFIFRKEQRGLWLCRKMSPRGRGFAEWTCRETGFGVSKTEIPGCRHFKEGRCHLSLLHNKDNSDHPPQDVALGGTTPGNDPRYLQCHRDIYK